MKKTFSTLLSIIAIIGMALCGTSCKNEYKDMLPGEVCLDENDYRNDDKIQDIVIATPSDTTTMSALEIRSIWHAIIIDAEEHFEYVIPQVRRTFENPAMAEEVFHTQVQFSLINFQEFYPDAYHLIIEEFIRAQVHVYAKYVWCEKGEEYVDMKFAVQPFIPETTSEITEK